ncbi:aminotransferase class I/II-fold pyridoxal phosphate-dependent enzyme [Companilactobacillus allii]|uniref:Aminotransferase n=1 Tax=Companilactobacillus allii TaxID=1847728 RepID=A0A1P8Q3H5_9LACO|nr:aminotransferase class I/II-fold pyridoxal phosphate-dependent enzyme [Companilactobacillus allii]APX72410.1 aromatic amino acid aminotransferase [Companilactobacillus allii]USQ69503.1 aminotransferase class I/II-fold pyridoxal phosphate-dependent enzyme [Companilactobacillus allii]
MPELAKSVSSICNKLVKPLGDDKILEFNAAISGIPGIVKLTLGEPDFNVPEHVKDAAIKSIEDNDSHYTPQKGIPGLRKAISNYLATDYDVTYDPDTEVIVTIGATEAIYTSLYTIMNPGDKIIVPTPTFSIYMDDIKILGGIPVEVDTSSDGFKITPEKLQHVLENEGAGAKAMIINYPGNPTGVVYDRAEIEALAEVLRDKGIFVISDEIYSQLVYGEKHVSFANVLPEQTILINGLSKSHAMTGYRIGYIAAPKDFVSEAAKVHSFTVTCPSNPAQYAAQEALENGLDDPIEMRKVYKKRRDYIVKELNKLGYETVEPNGAFYVFPKIPVEFNLTSDQFCRRLASEAKLGVVPGDAFGAAGEGYFRISYATSMDLIKEGIKRLTQFTNELLQKN